VDELWHRTGVDSALRGLGLSSTAHLGPEHLLIPDGFDRALGVPAFGRDHGLMAVAPLLTSATFRNVPKSGTVLVPVGNTGTLEELVPVMVAGGVKAVSPNGCSATRQGPAPRRAPECSPRWWRTSSGTLQVRYDRSDRGGRAHPTGSSSRG
jgi:hypothetical protein